MPEAGDPRKDEPSLAALLVYYHPWLLPVILVVFGLAIYFATR